MLKADRPPRCNLGFGEKFLKTQQLLNVTFQGEQVCFDIAVVVTISLLVLKPAFVQRHTYYLRAQVTTSLAQWRVNQLAHWHKCERDHFKGEFWIKTAVFRSILCVPKQGPIVSNQGNMFYI